MPDNIQDEKSKERSNRLALLKERIGQSAPGTPEATPEPETKVSQPVVTKEPGEQPVVLEAPSQQEQPSLNLPPGPPVKRRKVKGLKFSDRYETRSFSIDKRLLADFDDFMEAGDTKTQVANQVVLKILLEAGYNIDPTILSKPFTKPSR